ncbi:polysaccharide deacetylase family protein [Paenibacillus filicis]|uniref:Polysaccharide deacetylase family protein n=1 Tax=Paenibacillus gyeongsangnamensis TaxID=3388067 RepID=A0ABT4QFB0_9BACL|nr:polysaccharide deacetylase family protein [Paenibacillus filicis]MCZ8515569.1 polysaccharide deacetylase family protein [Paenibacillus filicis]
MLRPTLCTLVLACSLFLTNGTGAAQAGWPRLPEHEDTWTSPGKGRAYYEARGEIVWEVATEEKVIALTFDDGPDPEDTPQILDLLRQYGAKATFFAVGNKVERFPDLLRREVAEGHEIANHTYSHKYFGKKVSSEQIRSEIQRAEKVIYAASGRTCHLFRPPGGFYNERLVQTVTDDGYTVVLWSWHQDTQDWNTPGVRRIVNKVVKNARNGDIVLFHDYVEGKSQTVEALKEILPELKKRGFQFVTVSELLAYGRPVRK